MNEARSGGDHVAWVKVTDEKRKPPFPPLSPLPCEPPRTQEHCCRSQMMHTDTWGPNSSFPHYKHSPPFFFSFSQLLLLWDQRLFGLTSSPLDSISIAVTDNTFFRLLDGFEKHSFSLPPPPMCPSLHSVWTLALWWGYSSVVTAGTSFLPVSSDLLKIQFRFLRGLSYSLCSFH